MKKKHILILLLIVILVAVLIFLAARAWLLKSSIEVSELSGVELSVDPADISRTGLTFTIINNTADTVIYNPHYRVEKQGLFGWRQLNQERYVVPAVAYIVRANSIRNVDFQWQNFYGRLARGTYRLIIQFEDTFLAEEFTLS